MQVVGLILNDEYDISADVNGDGSVDILDVVQIVNTIMEDN